MLYQNRVDLSKGTDVAKINSSKKCIICHYWLFSHVFKFQNYFCVLILLLLLLSLLMVLIMIVLFMTLANQKQCLC